MPDPAAPDGYAATSPGAGIHLTFNATTAAIVKLHAQASGQSRS